MSTPTDNTQESDERGQQIVEITMLVAQGQGRRFSTDDLHLWEELLTDTDLTLALEATKDLLRTSTSFISVALINERVAEIAGTRLRSVQKNPEPPSGLSQQAYTKWQETWQRAVMRGVPLAQASKEALRAVGATESQSALVAPPMIVLKPGE